jgi:hypothetical protein
MKKYIIFFALIFIAIIGCTDNATNPSLQQNGSLKLYLVDSPSSLDSVIISVRRVEVHKAANDSTSGWYVINNTPRSFNLLDLRNGASAVLGDSVLSPGQYTQIRLILNNNNYVKENDLRHNLKIPSGIQTGIKLNHEFTIEPGNLYELVLDFNVDKSINITGNGNYMMKPVIRVMPKIISGTVSGQVLPIDARAKVFTTVGEDTVSTYPGSDGFFKLMALPAGSYSVKIFPGNTAYKDTVIDDVNVSENQNTNIGVIELKDN